MQLCELLCENLREEMIFIYSLFYFISITSRFLLHSISLFFFFYNISETKSCLFFDLFFQSHIIYFSFLCIHVSNIEKWN